MSIATWKKEFYRTDAHKFQNLQKEDDAKHTILLKAIRHSLRKWKGLTKTNIVKKHKIYGGGDLNKFLMDDRGKDFTVDETTCSLCQFVKSNCPKCILFTIRGRACDIDNWNDDLAPYYIYRDTGNAVPMINLLKKAEKIVLNSRRVS